ncbi:hypothetical protein [Chondrinema litorale]|uniref:hypothetical protein n=1 Tax=Chondrinema litorale TaxID=2994555 RepID=UPI0025432149|nr:hypothetical protein [Chondrinema litorale]UZR95674.1 hypothetical protein OQ292_07605 [Chondrinema litorale]
MELKEIEYIESCLDFGQKYFGYFKDRYALMLLSTRLRAMETENVKIADLKKSDIGFLLDKAPVKNIISRLPSKSVNAETFSNIWPEEFLHFSLELGRWGEFVSKHRKDSWYQTSRPGYNLVLRLNFSWQHDMPYFNLLQPFDCDGPFASTSHPVALNKRNTLAWARLDIDLENGEVLIEELQNDWLREAKNLYNILLDYKKDEKDPNKHWLFRAYIKSNFAAFENYYVNALLPYYKIWDEAILSAAIEFIHNELGISNIYFHTFETGNYLKELTCSKPPMSLYTKLPKRFGFKVIDEPPLMLRNYQYLKKVIRKKDQLKWYNLNF